MTTIDPPAAWRARVQMFVCVVLVWGVPNIRH